MIKQAAYGTEPWRLVEKEFSLDLLPQSESVFALSNGHIGLRGNLDEGEPHGLPGTYLNSMYEVRPLPYAEAGYGFPDAGQTVINVTNGKLIRLLVDDEPFDIRYGTLHSHQRVLDLRAGTLTRTVDWSSPAGARIRVTSVRMVSLTQRATAAISYTVEPVDQTLRLVLQSELVTNEELPKRGNDPRLAAVLEAPLVSEEHQTYDDLTHRVVLVHRTRASGLRMAAGMSHVISGPAKMSSRTESYPDLGRATVATEVTPGEQLRIVKFISYGWSSQRSRPALIDQIVGALAAAHLTGWDGLLAEQREYLDEFWDGADVELEGDAEVQQAVRFGLFHILQAGARAEYRPIAAKGLTGSGYDGHTFWDTESFVLPVLMYTHPSAAADALRWRHMVLPQAKQHAADLGLAGAAFPWRTIRGQECSGYWPAGTAAFHINADIADAVVRYLDATEDVKFEAEVGLELLVETARLWRSLGQHDAAGNFRIEGVTGPDEYSAIKDNNVYTNLMAQRNLSCAAEAAMRMPDAAAALGVTTEEAASWRDAAAAMYVPFDERLGVHPQHEGFTDYARWPFANTAEDEYPLLLHYPYFQLYRKQVVKQADLVLAMQLRTEAFTSEQKAANFAYYEPLTVRDSSLSACTQAVIAAEVGQLDLAHDYLAEAALMDLRDVEHNTSDGVHMASLAGGWLALVAGFGGMRAGIGPLAFSPRLPDGISALTFRMRYRGRKLRVTIKEGRARYELMEGDPLPVTHHGEEFEIGKRHIERKIPPVKAGPRPDQPPGRPPYSRGASSLFAQGLLARSPGLLARGPGLLARGPGLLARGPGLLARGPGAFVPAVGCGFLGGDQREGLALGVCGCWPAGQRSPHGFNHRTLTFSARISTAACPARCFPQPRRPSCGRPRLRRSSKPEVIAMRAKDLLGKSGEQAAADYLTSCGLRILDRNWRSADGEIDIVAAERRVLVVCEVKSRTSTRYGSPLEAVSRAKRARLRRLAVQWLNAHGVRFDQVRIDVVGLVYDGTGGFTVEHIRGVG